MKYELTIEGISCVKCAGRIQTALNILDPKPQSIKIDIITNIGILSIQNPELLSLYTTEINKIGYKVANVKELNSLDLTNQSNLRSLKITLIRGDLIEAKNILTSYLMSQDDEALSDLSVFDKTLAIKYNPILIRGSQIIEKVHSSLIAQRRKDEFEFKIDNPFEESNQNIKFSTYSGWQVLICLFCMISLVVMSFLPMDYITYPETWGIGSIMMLVTLFMTTVIMQVVGYSIFKTCIYQLTKKNLNMITLISLGSGLAFIFGLLYFTVGIIDTINGNFKEMSSIISNASEHLQTSAAIFTSVVSGKYVQGEVKRKIYKQIAEIKSSMKVSVGSVSRLIPKNKALEILASEELHPALIEKDDLISIKVGLLPFDGFVEKGTVKVIENAQFGWEVIETRTKGQKVISGSKVVHVSDDIIMRVTEPLEKTVAGKLFLVIKDTTSGSSLDEKTSEFIAIFTRWFIASILTISLLVLVFWLLDYQLQFIPVDGLTLSFPFERAITVLVASCPCALGTAIPMIYAIALRKSLKNGVLVKDSYAIDQINEIDTVVFDKTGTITGSFNINKTTKLSSKYSESTIWELISIIERDHLQHPIGLAIYQESLKRMLQNEKNKNDPEVSKLNHAQLSSNYYGSEGIIEKGITINGSQAVVSLGNAKLMRRIGADEGLFTESSDQSTNNPNHVEKTSELKIYLAINNEVVFQLFFDLKEKLKENVHKLMETLKDQSKEIHLLTGDSRPNALETARELGIKQQNVKAEVTPYEKEEYIRKLVESKRKVLMVGDGINDIKAFQQATLSLTINFKSPHNLSFSNFIIIDNDVENITGIFKIGRVSRYFKMAIIFASIIYNIPITLLSSGVLDILFGFDMPAFMAAWTMFLSSVVLTLLATLIDCSSFKEKKIARKKINSDDVYSKLENC